MSTAGLRRGALDQSNDYFRTGFQAICALPAAQHREGRRFHGARVLGWQTLAARFSRPREPKMEMPCQARIVVREFAGHSDIRTTELYFVRKEEDAEMAARRIQIRVTGKKDTFSSSGGAR